MDLNIKDPFFFLEEKMVKYKDLCSVPVKENNEKFELLNNNQIPNGYMKGVLDVKKIFGPNILARISVCQKLLVAQKYLQTKHPNLTLYVTFGYRSLKRQTERFITILKSVDSSFYPNPVDLYEEVHRCVAVPTVSGHPTGGAIDIIIKDKTSGKSLDFGSKQYDYSTKGSYVFFPNITKVQKNNRSLLRETLLYAGFAPFDGEWWHFSYGDREWAYYYKRNYAIYSQLNPDDVNTIK
jgi:zinc D-Ala-D-Ala dipeptidase